MPPAELIGPKTSRPSLSPDYSPRERLLDELTAKLGIPLVLITGPAGYGKTTLLSAWLERIDWPAMWISLDDSDNNLRVFVQYVVAAIQRQFPGALQKTASLLNSITLPEGPVLTSILINDLDNIDEPYILALDDYHVILDQSIHDMVAQILRHPPRSFHLAMTTRHDPMLPLSNMRAKGQVAEIRMENLRFNKEESAILLKRLAGIDLPPSTISSVSEQVDGWAAGLQLAALSLRHNPGFLSKKTHATQAGSTLMAYLFEEVLMQEPPQIQDFLVRTSMLNTLTPALCEAVVGRKNAYFNRERCLDYIARNSLFVNPVDTEEQVYRYHHLFQILLQAQLQLRCSDEEIAGLYARASDWYASQGLPDEAMHYAFIRKDDARAASLVSRFRQQLMNNDEWQRLEHWINQFPSHIIASSADLLVAEAYIAYVRYRRVECNELISRAVALIEVMPPSPEKNALRGEAAGLLAHYYYLEENDLAKCEESANTALRLAPPNHWNARTLGWLMRGGVQLTRGNRASAFEEAYRSLSDDRAQGDGFKVHQLALLGFLHSYAGDLSGQLRVSIEALKFDDSIENGAIPGKWGTHLNWARYHKGTAHYHRNELAEAEACLSVVVAQRYQSHVHCVVQSLFALSLTHQAMGRPDDARKMADLAAQYVLEMRCTTLMPATEIFQAQLALQQGRILEAVHLLGHRPLPAALMPAPFFFTPFLSIAKVWLAEGSAASLATAESMLTRLHGYAEELHNPRILMDVLALEALLANARQDQRSALATLEHALALAQPEGYVRIFADLGTRMADMLSRLHSRTVSPAFIQRIQKAMTPSLKTPPQNALIEPLTEREIEVLTLLQKRMSAKEIAESLFITPGTVKRHTHVIFQKLDVHSRRDAVLKAMELNLLAAP